MPQTTRETVTEQPIETTIGMTTGQPPETTMKRITRQSPETTKVTQGTEILSFFVTKNSELNSQRIICIFVISVVFI